MPKTTALLLFILFTAPSFSQKKSSQIKKKAAPQLVVSDRLSNLRKLGSVTASQVQACTSGGECKTGDLSTHPVAKSLQKIAVSSLLAESLNTTHRSCSSPLPASEKSPLPAGDTPYVACDISKKALKNMVVETHSMPFDRLPPYTQKAVDQFFSKEQQKKFSREGRELEFMYPRFKIGRLLKPGQSSLEIAHYNDNIKAAGLSDLVLAIVGKKNKGEDRFHTAGIKVFEYEKNLVGGPTVFLAMNMDLYNLYIDEKDTLPPVKFTPRNLPAGFEPIPGAGQNSKYKEGGYKPTVNEYFNERIGLSAGIRQELGQGKYRKFIFEFIDNNFDRIRSWGLPKLQTATHNALDINEEENVKNNVKSPHLSSQEIKLTAAQGLSLCMAVGDYLFMMGGEVWFSGQSQVSGKDKNDDTDLEAGLKLGVRASKILRGAELSLSAQGEISANNSTYKTFQLNTDKGELYFQDRSYGYGGKLTLGAGLRVKNIELGAEVIFKYNDLDNSMYFNQTDEGVPNLNLRVKTRWGGQSSQSPAFDLTRRGEDIRFNTGIGSGALDRDQIIRLQLAPQN